MNTNLNLNRDALCAFGPPEDQPPVALIGLDWGQSTHAYCIRLAQGPDESGEVAQESVALHQWLEGLQERFESQPVAFALEAPCPELMAALLEYRWARIYPIHPATSARFRTAFTPSGAKDDLPDAQVITDILSQHRDKLRPLGELAATPTRLLDGLVRARRKRVDQRVAVSLRLRAALRTYYPQALELLPGDAWTPMALAFLDRWPDLASLQRARPGTIRKFFYQHGVRAAKTVEARLDFLSRTRPLHGDQALIRIGTIKRGMFLQELKLLNQHIGQLEREIRELFKEHEESQLISNLPGAGPTMAPRLLSALILAPQGGAKAWQRYFGAAPVIQRSGGRCWVHRRWHAPQFLHQTFIEWAGLSVQYSRWAKAYYEEAKAKGKKRYTILRALAFKWLRILARCWETKEFYDEERYIAQLIKRGSPLARRLQGKGKL